MYSEWDNYVGSMYYKFIEYYNFKSELRDILRVNLKYIAAGEKRQTGSFFARSGLHGQSFLQSRGRRF